MDKATRALALAEENAQNIATLSRRCIEITTLVGRTVSNKTRFGYLPSGATVIVAFTGATCSLLSNNVQIASGSSPLIATTREGMLELGEARGNATAFVFK